MIKCKLPDFLSIKFYRSTIHIEHPHQQLCDGCFTTPCPAYNGYLLARTYMKVEIFYGMNPCMRISEINVLHADLSCQSDLSRNFKIPDRKFCLKEIIPPFPRC